MTATTIRVQMAQRKDTAANWTAANPVLLSGELGYETDTKKLKIGDGNTNWNLLDYLPIPDGNGDIQIPGSVIFEGATADSFETTLSVVDPTADRTITLPDVTGTVVTTGDTGSVTSTMLADGTIVNADVSATAEIAVSKLANGTANQVIVTDGTNVSWSDDLTLAGNLTVNGTTTTVNSQILVVEDKNIELGVVGTPTDVTADGGGITLKGTTDKTINWVDATDAWTFSEHVDLASAKEVRIAGTKVIDATSLGSGVVSSSLTSLGTIGTGVWEGTAVDTAYGGTGQTTYTDGQLLIGKTDGTLAKATVTAGTGITVTNGDGTITIDAVNNGTVTAVTGTSPIASTGGATPDISIQDATTTQKGAVQLEDSTSSTSTTTAATPNSVKAAYDLAANAMPSTGGVMTGDLVFEGSTADDFETTLTVVDPTADRTITLPDVTGTVVTTGDSGSVTSTMIADGTIVDGDINASAAIADTKLATIATAGKVSNSATTATDANTASAIVARDASGNFSAGAITASLTGNASSATALATARTIGGVSFDGTANIDLPGVNTAGNQDTSGNAATATKLSTARTFEITGDITGTVSSDLTSGASIAASIASGVIVDADINATAAIADTKLATISTAGKVSNSATTATDANTASAIVARDASGNFAAGTITADLAGNAATVTTNANLTGDVTSVGNATSIAAGVIVDADVNSSAAIAGTKISPDFGAQNVTTTGTSTAASFIPTSSTVPTNGVYLPSANSVALSTNGTGRLFIDSSGRVGIGTSSPSEILDAYGSIRFGSPNVGRIYSGDSNSRGSIQISAPSDSTTRSVSYGNNYYINNSAVWTASSTLIGGAAIEMRANNNSYGDFIFRQKQDGDLGGAERIPLVIDVSGHVGIGTTSPSALLHLNAPAPALLIARSSAGGTPSETGLQLSIDGTTYGKIYANSTGGISFAGPSSDRATIDNSGRLLVGTSSSSDSTAMVLAGYNGGGANLPAVLWMKRTENASTITTNDSLGLIRFGSLDSGFGASIDTIADGTWSSTSDCPTRLVFSTTADGSSSPTERMRIDSAGSTIFYNSGFVYPATDNATILGGGASFRWSAVWAANGTIQTSDQRAKVGITDATLGSDFIKALRPVSYKWVEGGKRDTGKRDENGNYVYETVPGTRTHWGFIAQEVKQAVDAAGVDFGGWVLTDKDDPDSQQALRYDQFIAPLTKALQEALEKIETLEAKVAALESV